MSKNKIMLAKHERENLEKERRILKQTLRSQMLYGTPLFALTISLSAWLANLYWEMTLDFWNILMFVVPFRFVDHVYDFIRLRRINNKLNEK